MTVEERQGKENGHGARDPFPVGMRVLAVDDDPTCLKLLETLLLRCQYHVTTTGQAVTALNLLREKRDQFDLVISDVHMPDMDGFKLLEHVGLEMDLPVIMLSANGATQTVMEGITHGACDYLLKPVRIEELRNIWQHVVRRRSDARNRSNGNSDDAGQKVQSVNAEGEQGSGNRNRKHLRKDNGDDGDDSDGNSNENMDSLSQKKPRVVWSVELHRKFVAAVNQLGIDKAVPKKILDLMNVENITRENVASHLQKYRLYLKRLSTDASRQANLAAAFAGRNPAYINMSSLESFKQYHAYGRYRPVPAVASSQSSNLLARMNSPSAFGVHGLLPSQPIQVGHVQSNLGNALKDLGGASHGNLLKGGPMSLQEATKCFPTGPSGNSFANISNGVSLLPPNKLPVQSLEPSSQPSLRMHSSSTDPFNALVGAAPHFPDLARCSNSTWQTAVPSKFEEVGHKDSMPSSASLMNGPKIEPQSSFSAQSGHVPMLGNELQSQAASITSSGTPMTGFNQETALFNFGSNTNSREMLNNNLAFSPSGMSSSLPSLCIDNSVVSSQTLDGGNASSIPSVHSRIDRQAVGDRLNYNNDFFMGTIKPQNGLSGGLDDIVVDMFKPDHGDAVPPFMDGDWELVSMP